jgi:hypothetical protein
MDGVGISRRLPFTPQLHGDWVNDYIAFLQVALHLFHHVPKAILGSANACPR